MSATKGESMQNELARRYRLLLQLYPKGFRDRRGEELVTTLLDGANAGQRWPSAKDAFDLARGAVHARWHEDTGDSQGEIWRQGIEAGGFLLALVALVPCALSLGSGLFWLKGNAWKIEGVLPAQLSHATIWLFGALAAAAVTAAKKKWQVAGAIGVAALVALDLWSPPLQRRYPAVTAENPIVVLLAVAVLSQLVRGRARFLVHRRALLLAALGFGTTLICWRWGFDYRSAVIVLRAATLIGAVLVVLWAIVDPRMTVALATTVVGVVAMIVIRDRGYPTVVFAIAGAAMMISALRVRYAVLAKAQSR